jgi:hypothetical protein
MQQKLKSVFRRSSKSRSSSDSHGKASPPRADRQRVSSDRNSRTSVDSSVTGSVHASRSRPVSSVYDNRRQSHDSAAPTDPNGGAIANDYKAYLPALSPVNDDHGEEYITLSGDRRHIAGESEARHEEDVANHHIARHSTSIDSGHRNTASVAPNGSATPFSGKYPSFCCLQGHGLKRYLRNVRADRS